MSDMKVTCDLARLKRSYWDRDLSGLFCLDDGTELGDVLRGVFGNLIITTDMIKVFTAFSGYDAQCLALKRLKETRPGFDFDLVGWSEIDKYAIKAHDVLFPEFSGRNYGDITGINWFDVPDFDLFTYSSPCQDFSAAGKQAGGEKGSGTRSSLLWECEKAIRIKRPKICVLENVKALTQRKFVPVFQKWCDTLASAGYVNSWKVLNAKDYGVPQNRERVFLVSRLPGVSEGFRFPEPAPLRKRLIDVLETNVDERYYIPDEKTVELLSTVKPEPK